MQRIKQSESVAARRRVFLNLRQEDGVLAWDGTVTGIKPNLSLGGAAAAASTNDIVKLAKGMCYLELTQAECANVGTLCINVTEDATGTGLASYQAVVQIVAADPFAGLTYTAGNTVGTIAL